MVAPRPPASPGRRRLLLASTIVTGHWLLGSAPALAQAQAASAAPPPPGFSPWLRLSPDGGVRATTNVSDIGQGTWAALRAVVAEQLDIAPEQVTIEHAPLEPAFHNRWIDNYATFGSLGLRTGYGTLAPAAAAARTLLVDAAAARWGVPAADCGTRDGAVWHEASGRSLAYAALLEDAARREPPQQPKLKPRAQWRLLGKTSARPGAEARVNGSFRYGIDVRRPGQLYAAVLHAPVLGARLVKVDARPARKLAGVVEVVPLADAVAVIARDTGLAHKALAALKPEWQGPDRPLDGEALRAELLAAARAGAGRDFAAAGTDPRLDPARTAQALQGAAQVVDQTYDVPFLAHAAMEPLNATVQVQADRADIWVATQAQADTQRAVARLLGLQPEQVHLHSQPAGGGFGRRLEHDWVLQAVQIARALPGRPVQMIWSRETDMRAGHYRPAAAARVRLALDADGAPLALRADLAGPSLLEHSGLVNGPPGDLDWTQTMGWAGTPYALPALHLNWSRVERGVRCGYWRSVGYSQNTFFLEHTLDLAARACGQEPLAYRRRLLEKNDRELAFVDALAAAADWSRPLPAGHGRGIAIATANGSFSGHVVEVAITAPGRFRLLRIAAALDAGVIVDPAAVEAQMTGGTVFGLSAALAGEIGFEQGRVVQGNFDRYPLVRLAALPPLTVKLLAGGDRPGGVGEEGPPTIGPALANALLAAGAPPLARLPLTRAGWVREA